MELLPPDDPWASYARTVVVIVRPGDSNLVVEARAAGSAGAWPWGTEPAVHVLTAWDPGDARPTEEQNRARQKELEADLRALGPSEMWSAVGIDPASAHREEGVVVVGLDADAVLALGARHGQDAIFEWTPEEWAIVSCAGDRRVRLGWSLAPG